MRNAPSEIRRTIQHCCDRARARENGYAYTDLVQREVSRCRKRGKRKRREGGGRHKAFRRHVLQKVVYLIRGPIFLTLWLPLSSHRSFIPSPPRSFLGTSTRMRTLEKLAAT